MEGFDSRMHSSDIDFKVIEVGEIIAKFDISGRDRSWRDYRQIRYFWPNSAEHLISNMARRSDKGQTVPPSNRESADADLAARGLAGGTPAGRILFSVEILGFGEFFIYC